jgi:hypothetical protein
MSVRKVDANASMLPEQEGQSMASADDRAKVKTRAASGSDVRGGASRPADFY